MDKLFGFNYLDLLSNDSFGKLAKELNKRLVSDEYPNKDDTKVKGKRTVDANVFSVSDESGTSYYVELPGCTKDTLKCTMTESGAIDVSAMRKISANGREDTFHVALGTKTDADIENIKLKYENGMLEINVPAKAAPKPRILTIG